MKNQQFLSQLISNHQTKCKVHWTVQISNLTIVSYARLDDYCMYAVSMEYIINNYHNPSYFLSLVKNFRFQNPGGCSAPPPVILLGLNIIIGMDAGPELAPRSSFIPALSGTM